MKDGFEVRLDLLGVGADVAACDPVQRLLREVGDAFVHACTHAASSGAGTLILVGRFDLAEFAVVLEPEEPLRFARPVFYAGMLALYETLALLSGDFDAAALYGSMLVEHTERHPVRLWGLWAQCFKGLLAARTGDLDGGLRELRDGLERAGAAVEVCCVACGPGPVQEVVSDAAYSGCEDADTEEDQRDDEFDQGEPSLVVGPGPLPSAGHHFRA